MTSPTGRGYVQGSSSYSAADMARMARMEREEALLREARKRPPGCTCWRSLFGMDVDRCPTHGQTLTWKD